MARDPIGLVELDGWDEVDGKLRAKVVLPEKDWQPIGRDKAGTEMFRDPETGRIWGQGANAGNGGFGKRDPDGDFVLDGSRPIPDEPETIELAAAGNRFVGFFNKVKKLFGGGSSGGGQPPEDPHANDPRYKDGVWDQENFGPEPDDDSRFRDEMGLNPNTDNTLPRS